MDAMQIAEPIAFFEHLGGLHDVEVERLCLGADALILRVGDLFGNFEGLTGYRGPLAGTLTFRHPDAVEMAIESCDCLTIFALNIEKIATDRLDVDVRLVPGGRIHLTCSAIEGDFDPQAVQKTAASLM